MFAKFSEGVSSPDERRELLQHLEGTPLPEDLPLADELPETGRFLMPDDAAARIRARILMQAHDEAPVAKIRRMGWWKVAAIALPLAGVATWMLRSRPAADESRVYVNDTRSVQVIRLDDGSEVALNRAARLSVRKGSREAWLEGEAFFTIAGSPSDPFVVHTGHQLDVTVLGTSFNVKTGDKTTEVVLNTGKVKVGDGGETLVLRPGEMAAYDVHEKRMSRRQADTLLHTSWKNGLIPFRERPLRDVVREIGEYYACTVVLESPEKEQELFTGYLPASDLQQSIVTLEQTFSIKIRIEHKQTQVNN
ncbi:FecR family protein [Chitinophaga lutea]